MDIGISEQFKGRYDGYMLLKFTSCQEFQQDFLDGKLFFNTADFFAQCDNLGRGDENEGNTFLIEHNNPDFMSANLESVDGKIMSQKKLFRHSLLKWVKNLENMVF